MAKTCEFCAKKPSVGHTVSHSNIKTLRRYEPNLQVKKVFFPGFNTMVRLKVCTSCIRTMTKMPRSKKVRAEKAAA